MCIAEQMDLNSVDLEHRFSDTIFSLVHQLTVPSFANISSVWRYGKSFFNKLKSCTKFETYIIKYPSKLRNPLNMEVVEGHGILEEERSPPKKSWDLLAVLNGFPETGNSPEVNTKSPCWKKQCTCGMFATSINDLPEELLVEIFRRLDVVNQIKIRRVCKSWNKALLSKSTLKDVIVDLSMLPVSTSRHQLKKLCQLSGAGTKLHIKGIHKRMIHILSVEPREFEFLWFTQICDHFFAERPMLSDLSVSNSFFKLLWLINIPDTINRLSLKKIQITDTNCPGIQYSIASPAGIFVSACAVNMEGGAEKREQELWSIIDQHVAPLNPEEKNRLLMEVPHLRRKQALAMMFVLRTKEPLYKDHADIQLTSVDFASLRPSTLHELVRMVLAAEDIYFDVGRVL